MDPLEPLAWPFLSKKSSPSENSTPCHRKTPAVSSQLKQPAHGGTLAEQNHVRPAVPRTKAQGFSISY